jgi:hypothetical protein
MLNFSVAMRNRTCTCNAKCNVHVCMYYPCMCFCFLDFSDMCVFHTCTHFTLYTNVQYLYLPKTYLYTVHPVLYADVYRMYFTVLTSQPHTDVFFHLFDLAIAECFIPFNWYPFILSLALLRRSAISSCRSLRRTSFSVCPIVDSISIAYIEIIFDKHEHQKSLFSVSFARNRAISFPFGSTQLKHNSKPSWQL